MIPKRTPISYYGGKQRMADIILRLMPAHKIYVEPYFGGGAIFFSKGKSYLEVINDINGNLVNFYQVMKDRFDELNYEIEHTLYSEELHKKAFNIYKHPRGYSKIKRAWAFWMITNNSFSCKIGGGWKFDNGTGGSHQGVANRNKTVEFKFYKDRLKHVQISQRDALTVINNRNTEDTFLYLDPPYPKSDQGHYKGFKISDLIELLNLLSLFKGKFILSNYALPELVGFANNQKWNILYFDMRLSAAKNTGRRKTEILIANYEINNTLF